MPQLVKRGKYVYGWSRVNGDCRIKIPPEASQEYQFRPFDKIILFSGSKTSKGFSITSLALIKNSTFLIRIGNIQEIFEFKKLDRGYVEHKKRFYSWTEVDKRGYISVSTELLKKYSVCINDQLLVVRGSGLALGFIKTGPIVQEAGLHPELILFE
jgi:hypothetical protein